MQGKSKKIVYKDVTYPSLYALAKELNLKHGTLYHRIKRGMSIEDAVKNNPRSISYKGVTYPNLEALAKAVNISTNTLRYRMRKGCSIEDAISYVSPRQIEYNGTIYPNMNCLARAFDIKYRTLNERLKKGYTIEEAITRSRMCRQDRESHYNAKPVTYKGVTYPSFKAVAVEHSIEAYKLYSCRHRWPNLSDEEVIEKAISMAGQKGNIRGKSITYNDIVYPSIKDLAKSLNLPAHFLYEQHSKGYTIEEALKNHAIAKAKKEARDKKKQRKKLRKLVEPIEYKGVTYTSISMLANAARVNPWKLSENLNEGLTVTQAISKSRYGKKS